MGEEILFTTKDMQHRLSRDVETRNSKYVCYRLYENKKDSFGNKYWVQVQCYAKDDDAIRNLLYWMHSATSKENRG